MAKANSNAGQSFSIDPRLDVIALLQNVPLRGSLHMAAF
jgi:hypothetical protein